MLTAGALLTGTSLGMAAAATPNDSPAHQAAAQQKVGDVQSSYTLTNLSPGTLTLASVWTPSGNWFDSNPLTTMAPGNVSRMALPWWFWSHRSAFKVTYTLPDGGTLTFNEGGGDSYPTCSIANSDNYVCAGNGQVGPFDDWTVQAAGASHRTVDATTDPATASAVLNGVCAGGANTSCSFTPTSGLTYSWGDSQVASDDLPNCLSQTSSLAFAVANTREESTSLGGSVSAEAGLNVLGLANSKISVTIDTSHTWTTSTQISNTITAPIDPGYLGHIDAMPWVGHVTGTYAAQVGNTSWTINNVVVNQPGDGTPTHAAWAYPPVEHQMSSTERATFCHGPMTAPQNH